MYSLHAAVYVCSMLVCWELLFFNTLRVGLGELCAVCVNYRQFYVGFVSLLNEMPRFCFGGCSPAYIYIYIFIYSEECDRSS